MEFEKGQSDQELSPLAMDDGPRLADPEELEHFETMDLADEREASVRYKLAYWVERSALSDPPEWGTKSSPGSDSNPHHFQSIFQRPSLSQQLLKRTFLPRSSSDSDSQRAIVPFSLKLPQHASISQFTISQDLSVALAVSDCGKLYIWKSQREAPDLSELQVYKYLEYLQDPPTIVQFESKISVIALSSTNLLLLTIQGKVWTSSFQKPQMFTQIAFPSIVTNLAVTSAYSIAITQNRDLYGWGRIPGAIESEEPLVLEENVKQSLLAVTPSFFVFQKNNSRNLSIYGQFSPKSTDDKNEIHCFSESLVKISSLLACEQFIVCAGEGLDGSKIQLLDKEGLLYDLPRNHDVQALNAIKGGTLTGLAIENDQAYFYQWRPRKDRYAAHIYQVEKQFLIPERPRLISQVASALNMVLYADNIELILCNQDSLELSGQPGKLKTPEGRCGLSGTFANIGEILKFRQSLVGSSSSPNFALARLKMERLTPQQRRDHPPIRQILGDRTNTSNSNASSVERQLVGSPTLHVRNDTPKWGQREGGGLELNTLSERLEEQEESSSLPRALMGSTEFEEKKDAVLALDSLTGSNEILGTAAFKSPQVNLLITSSGLQLFATFLQIIHSAPGVSKSMALRQEFLESSRNLQDSIHSSKMNTRYRMSRVERSSDMTLQDLAAATPTRISMGINDCSAIEPSEQKTVEMREDFSQRSPISSQAPSFNLFQEGHGHVRNVSELTQDFERETQQNHSPFLLKAEKYSTNQQATPAAAVATLPPLTPRSQPPRKNTIQHVRNLSEISKISTTSLVNYTGAADSPNISAIPKSPSALSFLNFTKSPACVKQKFKEFSKLLLNPKSPIAVQESADSNVHDRVKKNLANRFLSKGERAAAIVYSVLQVYKPLLKGGFMALKAMLKQASYARTIHRALRKLRPILDLRFQRRAIWKWHEVTNLKQIKLSGEKLVASRMIYAVLVHMFRSLRSSHLRFAMRRLSASRVFWRKCRKLLRLWRVQTSKSYFNKWRRGVQRAKVTDKTASLAKRIALQRCLRLFWKKRFSASFQIWRLSSRFQTAIPKLYYFVKVRPMAKAWVMWKWLRTAHRLRKAMRLTYLVLLGQKKRLFAKYRRVVIQLSLKAKEEKKARRHKALRKIMRSSVRIIARNALYKITSLEQQRQNYPAAFLNKSEKLKILKLKTIVPRKLEDAFMALKHFQGGIHAGTVRQLAATLKLALHRRTAQGLSRIFMAAITCRIIEPETSEGRRLRFPYLRHNPLRSSLDMLKSSATLMTKLKMKRLGMKCLLRVLRSRFQPLLRQGFKKLTSQHPNMSFHPSILSPINPRDSFGDNVRIGDNSLLLQDTRELTHNEQNEFLLQMGRQQTHLSRQIRASASFKSAQDSFIRPTLIPSSPPLFSQGAMDRYDQEVLAPDPYYRRKESTDCTIYESGEMTFKPVDRYKKAAAVLKPASRSSGKSARSTGRVGGGGGGSKVRSFVQDRVAESAATGWWTQGAAAASRLKKKNFLQDNINQIKILERQASKRRITRKHSGCSVCRKSEKENLKPNQTFVGMVAQSLHSQMHCGSKSPHIPLLNLQGIRGGAGNPRASIETAVSSVNKTFMSVLSPQNHHPLLISTGGHSCKTISTGQDRSRAGSMRYKRKKSISSKNESKVSLARRGSRSKWGRVGDAKGLLKVLLRAFQRRQNRAIRKVKEFAKEHRMQQINQEALRRLGPYARHLRESQMYRKERSMLQQGEQQLEGVKAVAKMKSLGVRLVLSALVRALRGRFGDLRKGSRKCRNRSEIERLWRKY